MKYLIPTAAFCLLTILCTFLITSCSHKDDSNSPDSVIAPHEALPEVTASPEQIRAEMVKIEPFSSDFEKKKLELLVAWEKLRKANGIEGFRESGSESGLSQSAYVDSATGRLAWLAHTCFNPVCPGIGKGGGPYLFVIELPNLKLGADGKLSIGTPDMSDPRPYVCPACGKSQFIRPYELPETILRQKELAKELDKAYLAYRNASGSSQLPTKVRSPLEIMTDVSKLPKLFIVPEPGQVAGFDRITAPIAGTSTGSGSR